jgi:hypothetical protein
MIVEEALTELELIVGEYREENSALKCELDRIRVCVVVPSWSVPIFLEFKTLLGIGAKGKNTIYFQCSQLSKKIQNGNKFLLKF